MTIPGVSCGPLSPSSSRSDSLALAAHLLSAQVKQVDFNLAVQWWRRIEGNKKGTETRSYWTHDETVVDCIWGFFLTSRKSSVNGISNSWKNCQGAISWGKMGFRIKRIIKQRIKKKKLQRRVCKTTEVNSGNTGKYLFPYNVQAWPCLCCLKCSHCLPLHKGCSQ